MCILKINTTLLAAHTILDFVTNLKAKITFHLDSTSVAMNF